MRKLRNFSIVTTMALTLLSVGSIFASATNYTEADPLKNPNISDTSWSVGNDYCRRKYDGTGVYVNNQNSSYAVAVTLKGRIDRTGLDYSVTGGGHATENLYLSAGAKRRIYQYVNELGYNYVHITFSGIGSAYGLWSPDSVGNAPYLN